MLEKILSSESIKSTSQSGKSTKAVESESSQFSKILASIDKSTGIKGEQKVSKDTIFDNLQELFQDDKEFLKESFQFLKGDEKLETEISSKQNTVLGLNFSGGGTPQNDQDFLVVINKAKEFLKTELLKKGEKSEEIPQTLRGLSQLAESKGIKLKDIKFDLNSETVKQSGIKIQSDANSLKAVVSQHSTSELLQRNSSWGIKRTNFTDQIPENLTTAKTEGSQKIDLTSILSGKALETKETIVKTENPSLNLSSKSKSLSDILKIDEVADKKVEIANSRSLAMAEKVGKSLSMTPEFINSLFTKDEAKDIFGTATETISEIGAGEVVEDGAISSVEKGRVQLKIGEAQIMSRHLATNLQQQVENYKHPFQKMSLTLNPEKLGEIEVDIFKRGNSVKISLSGNAQTMSILSSNQLELRNQLVDVGLENASFKFNEDGSNGQSQYQGQKQEQEVDEELKALFEIDVEEIAS